MDSSYEHLLRCLARWLAAHPDRKAIAERMTKRHGKAFVDKLRRLL